MTKSTGKKLKRKDVRNPNLKKKYNLKARRDYIDTHYVNGMKSITGDGSEGIRALNEQEKAWLNKFYGEYVNNSFKKDGSDLHQHDEDREEYILDLKDGIEYYKDLIKSNKMEKDDWLEYNRLKDELFEVDFYKNSSDRNNQRNRCLYNESKKRGRLTRRTMAEFDQDTMSKLDDHDLEFAIAVNTDLLND